MPILVADAPHGGRSRSTHEAPAKAIYFTSLALLTAATSGRVAARQQSFEASAKAIYFDPLLAITVQSKAEKKRYGQTDKQTNATLKVYSLAPHETPSPRPLNA